jgi:hypothetical protein
MAAITPPVFSSQQAVLTFVAATLAFASMILRSPHDYPAHAIDFATGLLNEAAAFIQADLKAR